MFDLAKLYISRFTNMSGQQFYGKGPVDDLVTAYESLEYERDLWKSKYQLKAEELPDCPSYIAHPQAVWFHEHWRPVFIAMKQKRDEARAELSDLRIQLASDNAQATAEVEHEYAKSMRLVKALQKISKGIAAPLSMTDARMQLSETESLADQALAEYSSDTPVRSKPLEPSPWTAEDQARLDELEKSDSQCVCGEINARHCPVHSHTKSDHAIDCRIHRMDGNCTCGYSQAECNGK